jgi:hypothetical protein
MNPDDPRHFYDWRAAYSAGATPDESGHWPSEFKREGHPRLIIDGIDTRTGEPAMRPMTAHTPRAYAPTWRAAPLVEEPAEPEPRIPIGVDPRLEPEAYFPAEDVRDATASGLATYGSVASGLGAAPAARAAAARIVGPRAAEMLKGAAIGAGTDFMLGGDARQGAVYGALGALGVGHLAGKAAARAVAGRAIAKGAGTAAEAAAPAALKIVAPAATEAAVPAASAALQEAVATARNAAATPAARHAARVAIQAAERAGIAIPAAAEAVTTAATKVASKGAERVAQHKALMSFAKQIAERNPKVGEKIWMLLDEAGSPVKLLTPDQAGAAARKGLSTTWVKNLWAH